MKFMDMIYLGFENLWRTKLRTILTTLGVIIGIGALTSMVSFGAGMQKNITDVISGNDLFTSLLVTAKKIDLKSMHPSDPDNIMAGMRKPAAILNDSTVQVIQKIPGVNLAFPEISFPVRIKLGEKETKTTLRGLPLGMGAYKPFSAITMGRYFDSDSATKAVLDWNTLKKLGLLVTDGNDSKDEVKPDTVKGLREMPPDSVIGQGIEIITATIDAGGISMNPLAGRMSGLQAPFGETKTSLSVCGILKPLGPFDEHRFDAGIIVPIQTAQKTPHLAFSSVWDILGGSGRPDTYNSIYVRVESIPDMTKVRKELEEMHLNIFSFADQLDAIRRSFLIFDAVLGAIGTIALVVAALGIVNTMVMSILERTREIGIMKAIGGSENEIKMIFFVEAGSIGAVGALLGLLLGWLVTRVANFIANSQFLPAGESPVNFFHFPVWLIAGAIAFSIMVSLAAGMYPAMRAARVDPVTALRHD
jgi:putative ABC transport system permease protein